MSKVLIVIAIAIGLAVCVHGATEPKFVPKLPTQEQQRATFDVRWTEEPWTGDDRPYALLRAKIDHDIAEGQDPNSLRIKYGAAAQQRPDDPLAQFAWAYASLKAIGPETSIRDRYTYLLGVPEALAQVKSPRTYDYARVRFLAEGGSYNLQRIGERLLHQNPNDLAVKGNLVSIYDDMLSRTDTMKTLPPGIKQRAIAYAEDLYRANPTEPRSIIRLGLVYFYAWTRYHDIDDAREATTKLQEYLSAAPPGDDDRSFAERFIKQIQAYRGD